VAVSGRVEFPVGDSAASDRLRPILVRLAAIAAVGIVCGLVTGAVLRPSPRWAWLVAMLAGMVLALLGMAVVRVARGARSQPGTVILVGDGTEAAIFAGILHAAGPASGHGRTRVLREPTFADAVARCRESECREIVVTGDRAIDATSVRDERGRRVPVVTGAELASRLLGRLPVDVAATDTWLATVGPERRLSRGYAATKRLVDVVLATALGLVLAPVAALVALAIWLEDRGPILVREARVGLGGRPFEMLLFRIERQPQWRTTPETQGQAARALTRIGRAAHRLHLDLLPALWNVVRGDLSMIGPRPERPADVAARERDVPLYGKRHLVKPGLASWAQVRFRYADTPRDTRLALEYDLYYAKHASLTLDSKILWRASWLLASDVVSVLFVAARIAMREGVRRVSGIVPRRALNGASLALPRDVDAAQAAQLQATLVVGAGEGGRLLVNELRRNLVWGYWPVAFVDDDLDKLGTRVHGLPVLGTTADLPAIVRREHIDAVVIAIPSAPEVTIQRIANLARQTSARVLAMPHLGALLRGEARPSTLRSVEVTDVLGRPIVEPDVDRCRAFIAGRRVLVTGAAGSIGREVARQVAQLGPAVLLGLDINESDLFDLQQELGRMPSPVDFRPVVASVTNRQRLEAVFAKERPEIVFHAAAYKHVPMMEAYPQEAVSVNVIGTYETARIAAANGVERFVLVSTDKAVRPSSVMGATKRLAELAVRAVAAETGLSACAVRFGNVLGSRGSVIPLFEQQIAAGGPVTVTHPEVRRYFMTIPEAAGLIIQAGAFGDRDVIYMLEMGEEVLIRELAERLIRLRGLRVGEDIQIVYTGLRPGEKLREDLALDFEQAHPTPHPKIRILAETPQARGRCPSFGPVIARLAEAIAEGDARDVRRAVMREVAAIDGAIYEMEPPPPPPTSFEEVRYVG